jgi:hypothetical protein
MLSLNAVKEATTFAEAVPKIANQMYKSSEDVETIATVTTHVNAATYMLYMYAHFSKIWCLALSAALK